MSDDCTSPRRNAGERVSGGAGGVERAVGQEAGGRSAVEVVGARRRVPPVAVVVVLLEDEAELPGVFRLHPGEVVGQGPEIVARTAPLGSAPVEIVVREINQREEQIRPRHVSKADLRAPALIAIERGADLPPVVVPEGHAIEERRADHAIPVRPDRRRCASPRRGSCSAGRAVLRRARRSAESRAPRPSGRETRADPCSRGCDRA